MTRNQIEYWRNVEIERSNRANEKETNRSNVAREAETNRHNVVTEKEVNRHNLMTELLTSQANAELAKHYERQDSLGAQNLELQTNQLAETVRSNLANEQIRRDSTALGYAQLGLGYAQLGETVTHNRNVESTNLLATTGQIQYNQGQLALGNQKQLETERSNQANESIQQFRNMQDALRNSELVRHNVRSEELQQRGQNYQLGGSFVGTAGRVGALLVGGK